MMPTLRLYLESRLCAAIGDQAHTRRANRAIAKYYTKVKPHKYK